MCTTYDEKSKLWSNSYYESTLDQDISSKLLESLSVHGSKLAQINDDTGARMTFDDLRLNTIRAAQNLQKRGYRSRQVFGFMANQTSEHLASIIFASFCLACPISPLHPLLSKGELVRILAKTKPSVIFCDDTAYNQLNEALEELKFSVKVFILGQPIDGLETVENLLIETGNENHFVPIGYDAENDVAGIFCSSGTTGPSKSVQISYSHHMFKPTIYDADNIVLSFDSIFWTVGVEQIIDSVHNGATRIITTTPPDLELLLQLISKYRVTILYCTPFVLIVCLKSDVIHKPDLSSVKTIYMCGTKVPNDLITEIGRYFPNAKCVSWYGLSELGRMFIFSHNANGKPNGGRLLDGFLAKIVDVNGNLCGPNESGELCIKKKYKFHGYLDDSAANAVAIDSEGFFQTGDICRFDEHEHFFIEDRIKNVISVYFFEGVILPSQIEEFLIAIPDIKDVCVVGIPIVSGEALPAALILRASHSNLNESDVYNLVAEHFPDRAKLRGGIYFVESLPKTPSGKLIRREITQQAINLFEAAKKSNANIQSYLIEIPEDFRKLI